AAAVLERRGHQLLAVVAVVAFLGESVEPVAGLAAAVLARARQRDERGADVLGPADAGVAQAAERLARGRREIAVDAVAAARVAIDRVARIGVRARAVAVVVARDRARDHPAVLAALVVVRERLIGLLVAGAVGAAGEQIAGPRARLAGPAHAAQAKVFERARV